jgi:hypothetical protein
MQSRGATDAYASDRTSQTYAMPRLMGTHQRLVYREEQTVAGVLQRWALRWAWIVR